MHTIEHKSDEEKLRFVSILMQNISDAVIGTDTRENSYKILSWNKGAEKLYGWKADEVLGLPARDVVQTQLSAFQRQELEEKISTGGHWSGEVIQLNRDNEPIHIQASVSIVRDEIGNEIGTVAVNRDISEKTRAEDKLRQSEEKYRQLSSTLDEKIKIRTAQLNDLNNVLNEQNDKLARAEQIAGIGSWSWNLATGKLTWSANLYSLYEIDPTEPITFEMFSSCLHPEDKEKVLQHIQSAAEGKSFQDFFHRIITPAGNIKTMHSRGETIRDEHGKVIRMVGTGQDITESIRQSEQLKKLSESDTQKNNFIAMASHELKTPITSIKGYVQLLLEAIGKDNQDKPLPPLLVRSSLLSINKQVDRLTRLITELLDLSKIERGTLELKKEAFSLNQLAIETVEDILYTHPSHQINIFHDSETTVTADKDRIGQVMINFLTNAIKYSPGKQKINVRVFKTGSGEAAFSVEDYGIGIADHEQGKIFDRFYRSEGKDEQTYPGFGIGLFIANEFVQKHGGRLELASEKGKGSVFSFTLPLS